MAEAWIIDAVRTPRGIGKVGKGALAEHHPQHVAATVLKALAERNKLNTAEVDDIIWGTSSQRGKQGGDMGRMAALDAGYDVKASGVTLDRFCGSGITTVNLAAAQIMSGMEDLVIAGGTEMMSYTSSSVDPSSPPMMDNGNLSLRAKHPQSHQGVCADAIATLEGITREDVDKLALTSQQRAAVAMAEGRFDKSIVPVYRGRLTRLGQRRVSPPSDHPRGAISPEALLRGDGRLSLGRKRDNLRRPDPGEAPRPED
jgi:acetyl-CoA C-acetyltransferase